MADEAIESQQIDESTVGLSQKTSDIEHSEAENSPEELDTTLTQSTEVSIVDNPRGKPKKIARPSRRYTATRKNNIGELSVYDLSQLPPSSCKSSRVRGIKSIRGRGRAKGVNSTRSTLRSKIRNLLDSPERNSPKPKPVKTSKKRSRSPISNSNSSETSTIFSGEPQNKKTIKTVNFYNDNDASMEGETGEKGEQGETGNKGESGENLVLKHLRSMQTSLENKIDGNLTTTTNKLDELSTTVKLNQETLSKRLDNIEDTVKTNMDTATRQNRELETKLTKKIDGNKEEIDDLRRIIEEKNPHDLSPKSFASAVHQELKQTHKVPDNSKATTRTKSPWYLNVFIHGIKRTDGEKIPVIVDDLFKKAELNENINCTTMMFRTRNSYIPNEDPPIFVAFNSGPIRSNFIKGCEKINTHTNYETVKIQGDRDPQLKKLRHQQNMIVNYCLSKDIDAFIKEGTLHIGNSTYAQDELDKVDQAHCPPHDYVFNKHLKRKLHKPKQQTLNIKIPDSSSNKSDLPVNTTPLENLSPTKYDKSNIEIIPLGVVFDDKSMLHINSGTPVVYQGEQYRTARHLFECLRARTLGSTDREIDLKNASTIEELTDISVQLIENEIWHEKREATYETALYTLMSQSEIHRAILLSTKRQQLIYAHEEIYWGAGGKIGANCYKKNFFSGRNTIGSITHKVRGKFTRGRH